MRSSFAANAAAALILIGFVSDANAWPPAQLPCDAIPFGPNLTLTVSPTTFTDFLIFDGQPGWPANIAGFIENSPRDSSLEWVSSGSVDFDSTLGVLGWSIRFRNKSPYAFKLGGGSWGGLSDRRAKKDIRDFTPGLSTIEQLRPRRYKYNGKAAMAPDDGQEQIGLVAQEVEPIAPYMVSRYSGEKIDGQPVLVVDPSPLTYVLINAVKEEHQMMESMEAELDGLLQAACSDSLHTVTCRYAAPMSRTR